MSVCGEVIRGDLDWDFECWRRLQDEASAEEFRRDWDLGFAQVHGEVNGERRRGRYHGRDLPFTERKAVAKALRRAKAAAAAVKKVKKAVIVE